MDFNNKRFITKGVDSLVDPLLQIFMWQCIDSMPPPKDYLQVFKLTEQNDKLKITHIQEQPEYSKEYLIQSDAPIFMGKIFVINSALLLRKSQLRCPPFLAVPDETHSTMLLAEEY